MSEQQINTYELIASADDFRELAHSRLRTLLGRDTALVVWSAQGGPHRVVELRGVC